MAKTPYEKAIQVASKRLQLKSAKTRNELLKYAADDLAEAYEIGAEETHDEIIFRLRVLAQKEAANR